MSDIPEDVPREIMVAAVIENMGPVFGTPEYLARPGNIERLEQRRQSAAASHVDAALSALRAAGYEVRPRSTEARRMSMWQPIDTCPENVSAILAYWPAYKLDENGYITSERYTFTDGSSGLIGRAVRDMRISNCWEGGEFELEANGTFFDDDFTFAGQPTHWMPLPAPPAPSE